MNICIRLKNVYETTKVQIQSKTNLNKNRFGGITLPAFKTVSVIHLLSFISKTTIFSPIYDPEARACISPLPVGSALGCDDTGCWRDTARPEQEKVFLYLGVGVVLLIFFFSPQQITNQSAGCSAALTEQSGPTVVSLLFGILSIHFGIC